ncbi:MAG: sporulation transcription factor Spo0A [Bacilli bacterium]|nr:sporulation transcription factor Spo0A [Bacilli bacterium]
MNSSIRVLVIDNDSSITKDVEKYFSSHEVIKVVACKNNGEDGLNYILNNVNYFDAIVMDILLPGLDGLFILSELKRRGINKNIIITTGFRDDLIMEEANSYGIDYFMLKPVNFLNLEKRLLNLCINKKGKGLFNQEAIVTDLLHTLGIPSHIRGFQYIRDGILLMYNSVTPISYITKEIYPELSKKYDTTPSRVERAIRHAIEVSWNRGDVDLMDEIFGNSLNLNRDKPTNSEYITTLSDRLKVRANLVAS